MTVVRQEPVTAASLPRGEAPPRTEATSAFATACATATEYTRNTQGETA